MQSSGQCSPCSGCLQKHTSSEGPRLGRDTGGKCSPVAGAAPSPGPPMLGGLLWCCCVSSGVYLLALGGGRLALARLAERWRKLSRFRLRRSCSEAGMAGTCVCGARTVVSRRADTNQPPYCGRATGGPNRRPGPNQPGTPAPGGRGTDAPRPPPVRTRFNGTTAPDVGFRARRGSGGVGDRGDEEGRQQLEGASQVLTRWARPVGVERNRQVYSKRARLFAS